MIFCMVPTVFLFLILGEYVTAMSSRFLVRYYSNLSPRAMMYVISDLCHVCLISHFIRGWTGKWLDKNYARSTNSACHGNGLDKLVAWISGGSKN